MGVADRRQNCILYVDFQETQGSSMTLAPLSYVHLQGCAQSVTCLAKEANLTADPGVASLFTARSHTFM